MPLLARAFSTTRLAPSRVNEVFICGGARTPIGSFNGSLSALSAPQLGAAAIKATLERAGTDVSSALDEVYMGCVLQAGVGQAPARQAALLAGVARSTPCTTVHKVCASGMKAVMLAAQGLMLSRDGSSGVMIAGGMESMSNSPFMLRRATVPYGGTALLDSIVHDGLTDAYDHIHMGLCAENTAKKLDIDRKKQDEYALNSYRLAAAAQNTGLFAAEITAVSVPAPRRAQPPRVIDTDEEVTKLDVNKLSQLRPAFNRETGTITAGNASKINDGAAAILLATADAAAAHNLPRLARIIAFADAACDPIDFPLAPIHATNKLLKQAGVSVEDISLFEINEAFSVVALANIKSLQLDPAKVNVHGGAVSMGHPIGMSGARITLHLCHALSSGQLGVASICNGGGGASAILLEKIACSSDSDEGRTTPSPSSPSSSQPRPKLTLFTKPQCQLCDEALQRISHLLPQVELESVDISFPEHKNWRRKYRYDIPVFHFEGQFLMWHRAQCDKLQRAINEYYAAHDH